MFRCRLHLPDSAIFSQVGGLFEIVMLFAWPSSRFAVVRSQFAW